MIFKEYIFSFIICIIFFNPLKLFSGVSHVCFVVNEKGNRGECAESWREIEKEISKNFIVENNEGGNTREDHESLNKIPCDIIKTTESGSATDQAFEFYESWLNENENENELLIVAVGGDGTVSDVVQKFESKNRVKFGILPFGTGNDLARTLGIPIENPSEALRILKEGKSYAHGAYIIEAVCSDNSETKKQRIAIGNFDLGVTANAGEIKRLNDEGISPSKLLSVLPRGLAYGAGTVASILGCSFPPVNMIIDGEEKAIPLSVMVSSTGPTLGGGYCFLPGMTPQNEKGQLAYIGGIGSTFKLSVEMLKWRLWRSLHMKTESFSELEIIHNSGDPVRLQIDGEVKWETPCTVNWKVNAFNFLGADK